MTADSALIRAQAAALKLMVDTCLVRRLTSTATNLETGATTPLYSTIYLNHYFRVRLLGHKTYASARRFELIEVLS